MLRVWQQTHNTFECDAVLHWQSFLVAANALLAKLHGSSNAVMSSISSAFDVTKQGCEFRRTPNHRLPENKRVVLRPPRITYFPGAFFMRVQNALGRRRMKARHYAPLALSESDSDSFDG